MAVSVSWLSSDRANRRSGGIWHEYNAGRGGRRVTRRRGNFCASGMGLGALVGVGRGRLAALALDAAGLGRDAQAPGSERAGEGALVTGAAADRKPQEGQTAEV